MHTVHKCTSAQSAQCAPSVLCVCVCVCVWAVCAELENEEKRAQDAQRELAAAAARVARKPAAPKPKQPKRQQKKQPKQPRQPKRAKTQGAKPKSKNLYTRHLTGLVVTGVLSGGGDSQIALKVKINDSRKKKMMAHYLKERPQADRDQMIGAIRQFMQERGDLSASDRAACERFIELLQT